MKRSRTCVTFPIRRSSARRSGPRRPALVAVVAGLVALLSAGGTVAAGEGETLDVLTFNVWHGLRSGETRKRFPGEDPERAAARFAWQIEEIRRLDPDVLLLQEVNPNQRQARRYAAALGYDEIHKVASCGLHLGRLYKIPKNVNEGLAILARPGLGLRRTGKKRLSGDARCSASWGFQTRESRYALFGEIRVDGRRVLLATTHLSSPRWVPEGFAAELDAMVEEGALAAEQRDAILALVDQRRERNEREAERLVAQIDRRRDRGGVPRAVVLGGDFNTEPRTETVRIVERRLSSATGAVEIPTWDPVANAANLEIGSRREDPVPTFGNPRIEELLEPRWTVARQIDHLFVSEGVRVLSSRRVLDRARDGIYPSDHFGILVRVRLPDD